MSYFEDQYDAWMEAGCPGDPTDFYPYEYWADDMAEKDKKREEGLKSNSGRFKH